jgi:hypothetical protein
VDIELQTVGAKGQPVIERRQRVLGPERRAATMRVNEGTGENRLGQNTILNL